MVWQDYVIAIAQLGFIIALIPTLLSKDKPPKTTSFMTAFIISIITFCLLTLELYFSALTAFGIAVSWTIVGIQKIRMEKRNKR